MCSAQSAPLLDLDHTTLQSAFPIAANGQAAAIYVAPGNPETVRVAAGAFASDVERVTGVKPRMLTSLAAPLPAELIVVGVLGQSPEIDKLVAARKLDAATVSGKWEAAVTTVVASPMPGVKRALVITGSDRRGAAFALFQISREMGVSPWTWWADVPVAHHTAVYVRAGAHVQVSPSVQYRGIFLNDEDWGLRPWAAKKMDPTVDNGKGNIGPNTYEHIFELLLRLHANSLWPAMHPGSLAFNAVPENAKLADKWGIVMGSSHSEALLRNNVGEWSEKAPPAGDGPWNYQINADAMNAYWDKRLVENGKYENFYTVGLRGVHDSGLEATGSPQVKAKLVEDVMARRGIVVVTINYRLGIFRLFLPPGADPRVSPPRFGQLRASGSGGGASLGAAEYSRIWRRSAPGHDRRPISRIELGLRDEWPPRSPRGFSPGPLSESARQEVYERRAFHGGRDADSGLGLAEEFSLEGRLGRQRRHGLPRPEAQ